MMKESIQVVENVETSTLHQKTDVKLKIRDAQINRLKDQIVFRDDLLSEARTMLNTGEGSKLQDNRIVPIEDIIFESQILVLPPATVIPTSSKINQGSQSPGRNYGNHS